MSIARDHKEWLSFIEVSDPFLGLPVLLRVFPQGLDALNEGQVAKALVTENRCVELRNDLLMAQE